MELPFNLDRALEGLTKITLRGGVVSKVVWAVVAVALALTAIAWSVPNLWLAAGTAVAVFVFAFVMLWRLINFADRHPEAAILEGAEFLVHQQIVHGRKSAPNLPLQEVIQVQPEPVEGPAANPEIAHLPDAQEIDTTEK